MLEPETERVEAWVCQCLRDTVQIHSLRNLKAGTEREVWECEVVAAECKKSVVLSIYLPGDLESVNTSLTPDEAVAKCALAMSELPRLGIPTASVLGHTIRAGGAALLTAKVEAVVWDTGTRPAAAGILGRLHSLPQSSLSGELQDLVDKSDPRETRTTGGHAPVPEFMTLVHGDYFAKNILYARDGLHIIDWETFGRGDPMWDLGFLIGADRELLKHEVESTIEQYERHAPVNRERLSWHQQRWSEFWRKRDG